MEPGDPLLSSAIEPDSLTRFVVELEEGDFRRIDQVTWRGPAPRSLVEGGHSSSTSMDLIIRNPWPYLSPLLRVPGINAWHADREKLCIWEEEDNTQRWTTLEGMVDRIDEWVESEASGFQGVETARNPEIYWEDSPRWAGLVDLDEMVAGQRVDGAHDEFHFLCVQDEDTGGLYVFDLIPTPSGVHLKTRQGLSDQPMGGRWFYRERVRRPPRNLEELKDLLTKQQKYYLGKLENQHLHRGNAMMFGLIWANTEGLVSTMILAKPNPPKGGVYMVGALRPKGTEAMLLRAGPDAAPLQSKQVAIIGVGAIGSHVADLLARSGVGRLHLFDFDHLWPANLIRHAAPPETQPGILKIDAVADNISNFPWVEITTPPSRNDGIAWDMQRLRRIVQTVDLTIDATGHAGFAEYAARVAHELQRPYITVGLFHGGNIARVRRQTTRTDTPILTRKRLDRYPTIKPLDDELEFVGTETGCLARIHNAPPVAVVQAAAKAVEVTIDHLSDRHQQLDEVIEVFRVGDEPFHKLGRIRPEDLPMNINITETAQHDVLRAASNALPLETGGVLVGCDVHGRVTITSAIEIPDHKASIHKYTVARGTTRPAVQGAQGVDPRVGYVGEWHSHPDSSPPSLTDLATMLNLAQQPDIKNPVLLVVSPISVEYRLQAFVTTGAGLKPANITACGDLPDEEDSPG